VLRGSATALIWDHEQDAPSRVRLTDVLDCELLGSTFAPRAILHGVQQPGASAGTVNTARPCCGEGVVVTLRVADPERLLEAAAAGLGETEILEPGWLRARLARRLSAALERHLERGAR
jgi:hypothetical protein